MRRSVLPQKTYEYLLRKLADGEWPDGHRIPSLRHLARELGVSVQPVHAACHMARRDGLLAVEPRRAVSVLPDSRRRAAGILAGLAARRKMKRLAILLGEEFYPLRLAPFQARFVQVVAQAGRRRGYESTLITVHAKGQMELARRIMMQYDAAFIVELRISHLAVLFTLAEHRFPALLFNRSIPGLDVPALTTDDYRASRHLAELLAARGHRSVCLLTTPRYDAILGEHAAVDGWMDVLHETGLIDTCAMPLVYSRWKDTPVILDRLLHMRPRVTGLVLGVPTVLRQMAEEPRFRQLRIPEELSIAAMSSTRSINWPSSHPPVTHFEIDWDRVGHCALEMIDQMVAGNAEIKPIRVPLNITLTESIGPAPA